MARILLIVILFLLAASPAQARKHSEFAYPLSRVWTAAVRLLRIDMASPIVEKDREEGYFLFQYPHGGRTYDGSVEVVAVRGKGGPLVRVVVQVAGLPTYVEGMVLSKLERKLKREFGAPVEPTDEEPPKGEPSNPREDDEAPRDGADAAGAKNPPTDK